MKMLGLPIASYSKHCAVPTEQETFADYVRRVANEKGLTYREVARRGGISSPSISDIISGKTIHVKASTITSLAKGLGVSEEEVFAAYSGKSLAAPEAFDSEIYLMLKGFDELLDGDKAELLPTVRMLSAEIRRRRPKTPRGKNGDKGARSAPEVLPIIDTRTPEGRRQAASVAPLTRRSSKKRA
jgi:transcriptional regulator with XRE-family HTH domain